MKKQFSYNHRTTLLQCKGFGRLPYTQLQRVVQSFNEYPKSMRMVEVQTAIMRPNICRYVNVLKKRGVIKKVKCGRCKCTGRMVVFYSTDIRYLNTKQFSLFD